MSLGCVCVGGGPLPLPPIAMGLLFIFKDVFCFKVCVVSMCAHVTASAATEQQIPWNFS